MLCSRGPKAAEVCAADKTVCYGQDTAAEVLHAKVKAWAMPDQSSTGSLTC